MSELSWAETVRQVHRRANNCCEYCQTCQKVCGQAMHVEHIQPSGGDHLDNLCLACPTCNLSKARAVTALDHETDMLVQLFNPRQQQWEDHFQWNEDKSEIIGKTPVGRATVARLNMNIDRVITARKIWVKAGEHPPT